MPSRRGPASCFSMVRLRVSGKTSGCQTRPGRDAPRTGRRDAGPTDSVAELGVNEFPMGWLRPGPVAARHIMSRLRSAASRRRLWHAAKAHAKAWTPNGPPRWPRTKRDDSPSVWCPGFHRRRGRRKVRRLGGIEEIRPK